ncbi:MAG: hypothetical protein HQL35_14005, partial [Alphaproteobacteria bacterium]|nr:hypothetical protein [Alphaproteobacteria bacterium]
DCLTCGIIEQYVNLANHFTQDLSKLLVPGMWKFFIALASLWIVIQGIRLALTRTTINDVAEQFIFVCISGFLLGAQGSDLIDMIFVASLKMMGAGASLALQVGSPEPLSATADLSVGGGLHALMQTAEKAITTIIHLGFQIAQSWSITTPLQIIYALILIVPYAVLWIVYFVQIVVSIFRLMILATISPFMMLGFGFGWGRDMAKGGIRSVIATFIVLFSSTAVIGLILYAVKSLQLSSLETEQVREIASITNVSFMVAVAMGFLGAAMLTEATGLANSIVNSSFTNNAAATVVAGVAGAGYALLNSPGADGLKGVMGKGASGAAYGAGRGVGHINQMAEELYQKARNTGGANSVDDLIDKAKTFGVSKDNS